MNASLESAYKAGEGWVGYTWSPTATTAKYDLVRLEEAEFNKEIWEESRKTEFPVEDVLIAVHKDFPEQAPKISDFLSKYETSEKLTDEGIKYILENEASAEETAIWWLKECEDIWTEWVSEDIVDKVKDSLD